MPGPSKVIITGLPDELHTPLTGVLEAILTVGAKPDVAVAVGMYVSSSTGEAGATDVKATVWGVRPPDPAAATVILKGAEVSSR